MKRTEVFACEICGTAYDTALQAAACEAKLFSPKFKVGDIVLAKGGFGWFDGDIRWVTNPMVKPKQRCPNGSSNCFDDCCCYRFYYVVTKVDGDEADRHRPRYHLFTRAMTGNEGHQNGWTFDENHYTPVLVNNPPAAVLESREGLLGRAAGYML